MQKTIFVDCFDTVIYRNATPQRVIFDWALKLGQQYGIEPVVLYKAFNKIKNKLAVHNKLKTGEAEYTFQDIAKVLYSKLKAILPIAASQDNFVDDALSQYKAAERQSHYVNKAMVDKLAEYKRNGCAIYMVSDFYCDSTVLRFWLEALGVAHLFDDIFVSCEYHKSKRTGKLYKELLQQLKLDKANVTMYGDNRKSDVAKAKRCGIAAHRVKPRYEQLPLRTIDAKALKYGAQFEALEHVFQQYGEQYNYSNFAFSLYLFVKRLHAKLIQNNAKEVFFLSREGQFLKKLFDKYCEINGKVIKSNYLLVSRNSVLIAGLNPLEQETFDYLIDETINMSVRRFLITLGFAKEDIQLIEKQLAINIDKAYYNFKKCKAYKKLRHNITFVRIYEQKRIDQHKGFLRYLDTFGTNFLEDGMHIVDVGWKGTMQNLIHKFFDGKVDISGYYIGCRAPELYGNNKKYGLMYSKRKSFKYANMLYRIKMYDYEQICRADHARVDGYQCEGDSIHIKFANEIDDRKVFDSYISQMQSQIMSKFEAICIRDYGNYSTFGTTSQIMYWRMLCNVSQQDTEWLLSVEDMHYDNFARLGLRFKIWKQGLRKTLYWVMIAYFKVTFGVYIRNLRPKLSLPKTKKLKKRKSAN